MWARRHREHGVLDSILCSRDSHAPSREASCLPGSFLPSYHVFVTLEVGGSITNPTFSFFNGRNCRPRWVGARLFFPAGQWEGHTGHNPDQAHPASIAHSLSSMAPGLNLLNAKGPSSDDTEYQNIFLLGAIPAMSFPQRRPPSCPRPAGSKLRLSNVAVALRTWLPASSGKSV